MRNSELNGLLGGRNEFKSSSFYTENYDGSFTTKISLWDAAKANPKNSSTEEQVARCKEKIAVYLDSKSFCDREDTVELMEEYANTNGNFAIFCGGPSLGKTLMLKNIASKVTIEERVYIMVDGRKAGQTPNLFTDMIAAFDGYNLISQDLKDRIFDAALKLFPKVMGKVLTEMVPKLDVSGVPQAIETFFKSKSISDVNKLEYLVKAIKDNGKSITIIIDEANKYFNVDASAPTPNALLDCLISLSKQERQLSVILSCSEFSFPYQMSKLKISTAHVRKVVVLHEIPPNEMFKLLVDDLEMGEELALALISFYGGSLLSIREALMDLSIEKNSYVMSVPCHVSLSLSNAEAEAEDKKVTEEFKKILKQLSVQGFAEIKQKSEVAEILVKHNVAAFLLSGAKYNGVSTKIRQPEKDGLIPALQIFRIAIPGFLNRR